MIWVEVRWVRKKSPYLFSPKSQKGFFFCLQVEQFYHKVEIQGNRARCTAAGQLFNTVDRMEVWFLMFQVTLTFVAFARHLFL